MSELGIYLTQDDSKSSILNTQNVTLYTPANNGGPFKKPKQRGRRRQRQNSFNEDYVIGAMQCTAGGFTNNFRPRHVSQELHRRNMPCYDPIGFIYHFDCLVVVALHREVLDFRGRCENRSNNNVSARIRRVSGPTKPRTQNLRLITSALAYLFALCRCRNLCTT